MEEKIVMLVVLIISVVLHEVAHGYAAFKLGDPTAKLQGRLTLNPIPHLDPMMSVILPGILFLTNSQFLFGAAKPVPYNPYNLTDQKYGEAKVAAAGPAANVLIAVVFAILIRFSDVLSLPGSFVSLAFGIIVLNIFLALFNLMPLPPLDGSKILPIFLPRNLQFKYNGIMRMMERNILMSFALVIIVVVIFLGEHLFDLTIFLASTLAGV